MAKSPKVFSHCERSPWYACTAGDDAFYSEYAGRLVLLSLGNNSVDEYWHLRRGVGLFDVPERPVEICGPDALPFLNRLFTRPLDRLKVGRGTYGLLCHQRGGLVCDGIVFRIAENRYWYVHADADVTTWLVAHAHGFDVDIRDPNSWVLQVQGPKSMAVLDNACDGGAPDRLNYFDIFQGTMGGQPVLVSRTGWSAELGFEIYNLDPNIDGPALWHHLLDAGAEQNLVACGQLSMNIRRIEAGILNYRTDMDWQTSPYDMGLGMFVDLEHDFIGRDALQQCDQSPRFTGFTCEAGCPRYDAPVKLNGETVGRVTACEVSPYLQRGVGFVLFDSPEHLQGSGFTAQQRDGSECSIELVALPFYDAEKNIPRGLPPVTGAVE